jgi:regulator of protease activity HflC (stomatin/prohibitin superfamily)
MLEGLVEVIKSLRIVTTIDPHQKGVWVRRGEIRETYGPSMRFMWPVIDDIHPIGVNEQVVDLRCQSITTKDGKAILVSGKLKYRVFDAELALFAVDDWDQSLANEALGIICTECMKRTFAECLNHEGTCNEIEKAVRRQAKKWGIEIIGFTLTDMVVHRALRLEWNKSFLSESE